MVVKRIIFLLSIVCFQYSVSQQISIDNTVPLQSLIEDTLIQGCVEVSNITSPTNGAIDGIGSFGFFENNNSNFPFQNGIVLSTGNANSGGNNVNAATLNDGTLAWGSDTDLENVLGISDTFNATVIEFNFTSATDVIQFNYLLASEEYFINNPCNYADGFAFLIRQVGTVNYQNIAIIPNTTTAVNTTTIRPEIIGFCDAQNDSFFEGYNLGDTNFNGRTTVLTATANIQANVEYEIKLVIADQDDQNFDSAVFIEGNSFSTDVDLGEDISTCSGSLILDSNFISSQASYTWFLNNVEITGANQQTLNVTQDGNYRVEIETPFAGQICSIQDDINITLNAVQQLDPITDYNLCDINEDGVQTFILNTKNAEAIANLPPSTYTISYHNTNDDAANNNNPLPNSIQNTTNNQPIFVRIVNTVDACISFTTFNLVVNSLPDIVAPTPLLVCVDESQNGIASINLNLKNIEITNSNSNLEVAYFATAADAENGNNPLPIPYTNTNVSEQLFVRVTDLSTGCINLTTLDVVINDNPIINSENLYLDACDQDYDGFAEFDLNAIIPQVIQDTASVTITFHDTQQDAELGENAITNTSAYTNTVFEQQIVFIRVEDATTGCASIAPFEIHPNLLLTGTIIGEFSYCDNDNNGSEFVDLENIANQIINDIPDLNVEFYETENDRDTQTNEITNLNAYSVTSGTITLYIRIISPTCAEPEEIQIRLEPSITFAAISNQTVCDTNQDLITTINLSQFDALITNNQTGDFSVSYYLSAIDAEFNLNSLPTNYTNTSPTFTLYTRIASNTTGCASNNQFQVTVLPAPVTNTLAPLVVCDTDTDGFFLIDLNNYSNLVTNQNNVSITFYNTLSDAQNATDAITNLSNYNAQTETIFIRVENNDTNCTSFETLSITVNRFPTFGPISTYLICENNTDGFSDFILNTKDNEILNGQTEMETLYFITQSDADNRINPIDKNTAFTNTSNPQEIFVRVEHPQNTSCYNTSSFLLESGNNPEFTAPSNLFSCDDFSNDGVEIFDLNIKTEEITATATESLTVTYHLTANEAENGTNALPIQYQNTVNPQEIYARISTANNCFVVASFELVLIPVPDVNDTFNLTVCDEDYDGFTTFNLTEATVNIADIRLNNLVLNYYPSMDDLNANTNEILNPETYTNITNPQTAVLKVTNILSNCFSIITINMAVNLPPQVINFEVYNVCENLENIADLTEINNIVTPNTSGITFTYYNSLDDAETENNPLNAMYNYGTALPPNAQLFVRLEFNDTGCVAIHEFTLQINPVPTATPPNDMYACEDISNDGVAFFDLSSQNTTILGSQNPNDFNITYHLTQANAESLSIILPENYTGAESEIFARVTNANTGCFTITNFNLHIVPFPNQPQPITVCDEDFDGITTFDLTEVEASLFDTPQTNIVYSYFETENDVLADTNAINNPSEYTINLSNPVVYVKAYHTLGNCFNYVSISLNVNPVPQLNLFDNFEICSSESNSFDLNQINNTLIESTFNVDINYFTSLSDAEMQLNPITTAYIYSSNADVLFARVSFSTTGCVYIHPFNLIVNQNPNAGQPNDLVECDDDADGLFNFNLTDQNAAILNGLNANLHNITYHISNTDAATASNPIDALNFAAQNNTTVYARLTHTNTGCFSITSFNTIVRRKPSINIPNQALCLDNLPLNINAQTPFTSDTYSWTFNAQEVSAQPSYSVTQPGIYTLTITSALGCTATRAFTISASEPASIDVVEVLNFSDPNNIRITINGIGNYEYQLDDGVRQSSNVFTNISMGYHTVTIYDLNGCGSVTREVLVIDYPKFFTPNGDSDNPTWHIVGVETLPGTIVYIFDKYGKLIKTLPYNSNGWDGTYRGFKMPASDYWFKALLPNGREINSHFSLKR